MGVLIGLQIFMMSGGTEVVQAHQQGRLLAQAEDERLARSFGIPLAQWQQHDESRWARAADDARSKVERLWGESRSQVTRLIDEATRLESPVPTALGWNDAEAWDAEVSPKSVDGSLSDSQPENRRWDVPKRKALAEGVGERTVVRGLPKTLGAKALDVVPTEVQWPLHVQERKARRADKASLAHAVAEKSAFTSASPAGKRAVKTIAPEIVALAADLDNSPARIFRFVHDQIHYDPKWGADSTPLGTYWERRGTSWDQAWLLQELLMAAGVDARLEWGEVEIPTSLLTNMAGIDDPIRAGDWLATAGLEVVLLTVGSQIVAARFPHVWVKAHLDYIPNRGVTVGSPDTWIRMDPSLATYQRIDGLRLDQEVPFDLADHLTSGTELSPRQDYESALLNHVAAQGLPVAQLDEAKALHRPLAEDFPFVPGTLRAQIVTSAGESESLPSAFEQAVEIQVQAADGASLLTFDTTAATLYGQRLELLWTGATASDQAALDLYGGIFATPPYEVDLKPTLRLGGIEVASGSDLGSAEDAEIRMTLTPPAGLSGQSGNPTNARWDLFAGEHGILSLDYGQTPQEVVDRFAQGAAAASEAVEVEGWKLAQAAATYLQTVGDDLRHLTDLSWHRLLTFHTAVFAVQRGASSSSPDGTPQTFSKGPLALDVGTMPLAIFPADGVQVSTVPTLELLGSQGSFQEAAALSAAFGGEHLTAVTFLTRAVREGQELTRVDSTNVDAALGAAEISTDAKGVIRFAVERGMTAWISQTQIESNTFQTTGYILLDPQSGAGGYFVTFERRFTPLEGAVTFHNPIDLDVITAPTEVIASIDAEGLESWTLSTRPAGEATTRVLATGSGEVNNAVLGTFDPTLLLNGMHELVLTGIDGAGQTVTGKIDLVVEGNMKLGHFTLSFTDVAIPVSGLDVSVIRTYDSRDLRQGDFGVGWSLDIRQGSYRNNRPPGQGWQFQTGFLPCDTIFESAAHRTVIRLSDREVYTFKAKLIEGAPSLGGCFGRIEFEQVDGPVPGVRLEVVGNDEVFWANGSDQVLDVDLLEVYEPQSVRLRTRDDRTFDLDLDIGVTRIRDASGVELEIDEAGIRHSLGKSIAFTRDAEGRIVSITDPLGHAMRYAYDGQGDLVQVTDQEDQISTLTYDGQHLLLDIHDPRGVQAVRAEYDADGRLIQLTDATGQPIQLQHDPSDRRQILTDRTGRTRVLEYDGRGNVTRETDELGNVTLRTYDSKDRMLTETDPFGGVTTRTFNSDGTLAEVRDPLGSSLSLTYDSRGFPTSITDPRGGVLALAFDGGGNMTRATDALGSATTFAYNGSGNMTRLTNALGHEMVMEYDGTGNLTRVVDPLGAETLATYDANNRKISETVIRTTDAGPQSLETRFEYDRLGRVIETTLPDGTVTTTEYDPLDAITSGTDALGRTHGIQYDLAGRPTSFVFPDGTTEGRLYDGEGRLVGLTDRMGRTTQFLDDATGRMREVMLPDGTVMETEFDALGRMIRSVNGRGGESRFEYDAAGRMTRRTDPLGGTNSWVHDAGGHVVERTDALGRVTSYEYDLRGSMTRAELADGSEIRMEYDALGQRIAKVDAEGRRTGYEYDAVGQLVTVIDPAGGETRFTYDELGNPLSRTDALGRTTSYEYDVRGRMIRTVHPDGANETFAYDAGGNLTSHTEPSGDTTTFAYDAVDQLVSRTFGDGTTEQWTYTPSGKRATAVDARGTTRYTYDARDRLIRLEQPGGGELRYAYDADSNRTSVTADLGAAGTFVTATEFDLLGRPVSVTDPVGGAYQTTYDAVGNALTRSFPNGAVTTQTWDVLNQLVNTTTRDTGGTVLQSFAYTLSATGQRLSIEDHDGFTHSYTYDALDRLVLEERVDGAGQFAGSTAWSLDAVGNRIGETQTAADGSVTALTSTFDLRDRLVDRAGSMLAWDAEGRLVDRGDGTTFSWNDAGRLEEVQLADGSRHASTYDVDGLRVASRDIGAGGEVQERKYLLDSGGPVDIATPLPQVVAQTDADGDAEAIYVRSMHELLAVVRGGEARYVHPDGLGSTRSMSDADGNVTDRWSYAAFGSPVEHQGSDDLTYQFAGQPREEGPGLDYLRERWMDPALGILLSPDAFPGIATDPVTFHPYLYGRAQPVNFSDPTGLLSMAEANTVMAQAANLSRIAVQLFRAIDKARSFVDMVETVVGLLQVVQSGNVMDYIKQAIRTSFDTPNFGPGDVADSIARNIKPIFNTAHSHWIPWLVSFGRGLKGLGMWMPNPGILPANNLRFDTGLRLKRLKVFLILQGKEKSGSLMGIGFVVNVPNLIDLHQMWRIDFHAFHFGRGAGGGNVNPKKEIDVWLDFPFHYHVLKPQYVGGKGR